MIGRTLSHYTITGRLGAGGMGEVYEALDSQLRRNVAIKFLPPTLAQDAEHVARFRREARMLAALNHPNIAGLYGLEDVDGQTFLVMELVPGETLSDRLRRGPIPVDEALGIARQIVDALDAAHEKGVVHRDLKPANIKITPEGSVKVLDFGLAKALGSQGEDWLDSPTQTMTQEGLILGTAAYMSPEQARGKSADGRTDIWAFGAVLYEMVTGRRLFQGQAVTEILAAVLEREIRLDSAPERVRTLLASCLERDARKRLRDIGDAWRFIDNSGPLTPIAPRSRPLALWVTCGVLAVAAMVFAALYFLRPPQSDSVVRFDMPAAGTGIPMISPDGELVAYTAAVDGRNAIWIRSFGSLSGRELPGTQNALQNSLFWSADSRALGFHAEDGRLKRIDIESGAVQTLYEGGDSTGGGAWNRNGDILFGRIGPNGGVIMRVSSSGGTPVQVTTPTNLAKEGIAFFPQFLPDDRHFIYHVARDRKGTTAIVRVGSLDAKAGEADAEIEGLTPERNAIVRFTAEGYLLFTRGQALLAQPFSPEKRATTGPPFVVEENVGTGFTASSNGRLVYHAPSNAADAQTGSRLLWFKRNGSPDGEVRTPEAMANVRLSRDGQRIAFDSLSNDVWIADSRGVAQKLTPSPEWEGFPVWKPDGTSIVYSARRNGAVANLFEKSSNGVGDEGALLPDSYVALPRDWSSDGEFVVYDRFKVTDSDARDIWILPTSSDRKPRAYLATPARETEAQISPDGRYIAYVTNESGQDQIVVRTFPDPSKGQWQVTSTGGTEPRWRGRDGRELYYLGPDGKIMVVSIAGGPAFSASQPFELFKVPPMPTAGGVLRQRYDVSPDGQRFLFATVGDGPTDAAATTPISAIVNWTGLLKKKN